jgi:hypothetical protein
MNGRSSSFSGAVTSQRHALQDCTAFISNATVASLLAMTADRLCRDKSLTDPAMRADVADMLAKAQTRERRRAA